MAALIDFEQSAIELACQKYINNQPRRRPTPADIRSICADRQQAHGRGVRKGGDKSTLTFDEIELLETKLIPTARRWLDIPDLRDHGRQFLDHWGEA